MKKKTEKVPKISGKPHRILGHLNMIAIRTDNNLEDNIRVDVTIENMVTGKTVFGELTLGKLV